MHEHEVPCACLRAVENSALAILTLSQTLSWSTRLPRSLVTAFSLIPKTCGPMLSQEMTLNVPCPRGFPVRNFLRPPLIAAQHPPGRSLQRLMHRSWSLIRVSLHLLPPMVNIANVIPTTGSFLAILSQVICGDFEHVKHVLSYMLITIPFPWFQGYGGILPPRLTVSSSVLQRLWSCGALLKGVSSH
jgi:hypothetical protein